MIFTHSDNQILWQAADAIRIGLQNSDALCTFSLGEWGGDARELLSISPVLRDKLIRERIIIEIHPYKSLGDRTGVDYLPALQKLGYPILIGEMGDLPWDPQDGTTLAYNQRLLDLIRANSISFAWFAVDVTSPYVNHIYNQNGITDYGRLVTQYFSNHSLN